MLELKKLLKNRNNRLMLVIFIIGIVIIMLSSVFSSSGDEASQAPYSYSREEERLSEILSQINGVGRVSVMISYQSDTEHNDGIGRGFGYNDSDVVSEPKGVIVVADGADSPQVRRKLQEAAAAVTGVGANRVCVYKRDGSK